MKLGSKNDLLDTPANWNTDLLSEVTEAYKGLDYTKYALSTIIY